ncbi:hypothetical protein ABGB12_02045 [Actinocorallia sp. B10E7]|uniref:hypothetical protein n=1 Tax=Actinocorallia sp. B10E7 TaxID=3153558 RepID=UPI00325E3904
MHSNNERVARYTLRDRGRELAVEAWEADGKQHARLLVDGEVREEKAVGVLEEAKFDLGEVEDGDGKVFKQQVKAAFWWGGRLRGCDLLETRAGVDEVRKHSLKTPFVPPEGTRARKRYEMRERHPHLYAMRHVALEGAAIVIGFLGIGALLSAFFGRLLPSLDWSWLPDLPDLPNLDPPDWLRYLSPVYWVRRLWPDDWTLPDLDLLAWLPDWDLSRLKFVGPLLIALGVGAREIERRRKRRARERRFDQGEEAPARTVTPSERPGSASERDREAAGQSGAAPDSDGTAPDRDGTASG